MNNPLYISKDGNIANKIKEIINVVNILTQQMFEGKVKQAQNDIAENKKESEAALLQMQADMVEAVIDEYEAMIGG